MSVPERKPPCPARRTGGLVALIVLAATAAQATEPTPPILFVENSQNAELIPLAVDVGQVTDLELSVLIMQDGDVIAEERIDYGAIDVRELDAFPAPYEEFQIREQKENATPEPDEKTPVKRPSRLRRQIEPRQLQKLQLEKLPQLRTNRQQVIDALRGGVDVQRAPAQQRGAKTLLFLIPAQRAALKEMKDGYYAVSYMASASWINDPSSKRIEAQMWGRYEVRDGQIRPLSLQEYSDLTDPVQRVVDAAGKEEMIYAGRFGLEKTPVDQTKKTNAMPINIESGVERPDSGSESERAKQESERDEK